MTRHSLDCPTALVLFVIRHEDRAGTTQSVTAKEGEIVAMDHGGQAVIAVDDAILQCPVPALHRVPACAALLRQQKHSQAPDFIAAQELVRFIPAQEVPFTLRWLEADEAFSVLREWCDA